MAFKTLTVPGHQALLDEIRRMAVGWPDNQAPGFSGTGNGTIWLRPSVIGAPAETWTITCTDATTAGSEVWSVSGSTSGAQAAATTGVAYDNSIIKLDITAGLTNFAVSDAFTVVIAAALVPAAQRWTENQYDLGSEVSGENRLQLEGPGLSGTDAIYVGFRSYENTTEDWYNLGVAGNVGYNSGVTWENQPGHSDSQEVPLYNQQLEYWLAINGQRIVCGVKVETVYSSFYAGFIEPYCTPGEFPYPLAIIAMVPNASEGTRYSATSYAMGIKGSTNPCYLRRQDGVWENVKTLPYTDNWTDGTYTDLRDTPSAEYPLLPVELFSDTPNLWGLLDGVRYVPGFNLVVEDTITVGADVYRVLRDSFRTGFNDYFALLEE